MIANALQATAAPAPAAPAAGALAAGDREPGDAGLTPGRVTVTAGHDPWSGRVGLEALLRRVEAFVAAGGEYRVVETRLDIELWEPLGEG